jgi:hypothetical protein
LQKWEYRVVDLIQEIEKENAPIGATAQWLQASDLEEILNKLGAQGWELVAMPFMLEREEPVVVGFFKRPVS